MKGPITEQPSCYPVDVMDPNKDHSKDNLLATESGLCQNRRHARQRCCNGGAHEHNNCHKFRRRVLFLIFGVLLLLGVLLAGFCAYHSSTSGGISSFWNNTLENLGRFVKRAPGDPQNDNGVFIDRKYYLIIIFVGLFLVVVLGIMLSAWCCRGVFENPLCCPCYLCACCGGLACLECIGCGLCAEGFEQI